MSAQDILDRVREALPTNRAIALDIVCDELDTRLLEGRFDEARDIIQIFLNADLPRVVLLSAYHIAKPWREPLGEVWGELEGMVSTNR